ncbi:MAG: hypothetical protein P4M07_04340, partial [Xanthobacteraceae bacterium]|nr:hypothetical protein [Xanthobacteraceae bacterium]
FFLVRLERGARGAGPPLHYNVDVARSTIAGSLDAWSWAIDIATLKSPADLAAVSAKHADRQAQCLAAQGQAYSGLVDWAVDEFLDHDTTDGQAAVTDQSTSNALLLRLME